MTLSTLNASQGSYFCHTVNKEKNEEKMHFGSNLTLLTLMLNRVLQLTSKTKLPHSISACFIHSNIVCHGLTKQDDHFLVLFDHCRARIIFVAAVAVTKFGLSL